jgi:GGDEF domain-containing protein
MIRRPDAQIRSADDDRVVIVCRSPGPRAMLERLIGPAETHAAAVEAVLSVTRRPARAVVINTEDVIGSEHNLLAALRRAGPGVPIYPVVKPENEPLGRRMVREGAADYFVTPDDVGRLPQVLARGPGTSASPAAKSATADDAAFQAACSLADLAPADSQTILRDGAAIIFRALGAARGCLFVWNARARRLDLAASAVQPAGAAQAQLEDERTAAERVLRTGETLVLDSTRGGPLLCIPVRDAGDTFGVLCTAGADRTAAESLVRAMARLHRAALGREEYARLALRDPETGLLTAGAFRTYLSKLIARAAAEKTEIALVLLQPRPDPAARAAGSLGQAGRAIVSRLAKGRQGGRLAADRFAVTWSRRSQEGETAIDTQTMLSADAAELAGTFPPGADALRLKAAVALFPKDGADAASLLAAAETRLANAR